MKAPPTRYLDHDGTSIAWQVFGEGPAEILIVPGWVSNVDQFWIYPDPRRFLTELAGFSRVAMYDKPGTGASDPIEVAPTVEQRVEQLVAVMDAAEIERPTVIGVSEGGITACLAAAGRPDRVGQLVLLNASAGGFDPRGKGELSDAEFAAWRDFILATAAHWGEGRDGDRWLSGVAEPDEAWGRLQRACATPAVARRYIAALADGLSAWDILEAIHQPTLVLQRRGDQVVKAEFARAEAERIPNARYFELPGAEHLPWLGETEEMLAQLRDFVGAPPPTVRPERILATVLFTDIVDSTRQLAGLGDRTWRDILDAHDAIVHRQVEQFRGRVVKQTGDGVLAIFDGPARAIRGACALRDELRGQGIAVRTGLHTGEVELRAGDVGGIAVHIAARVMSKAGANEVWVSRTVKDLVAGSGVRLAEQGVFTLKGVPDEWRLYSVEQG